MISRYGAAGFDKYTIGTVPTAIAERDKKYSIKADWNIMEGQRFSVSYIFHQNVLPSFSSGSASGSTSATSPYIALQSDLYQISEKTKALSGQLNSQWSDNLTSEIRVAYKYYRRGQDAYFGPDYAQMNVCTNPTGDLVATSSAAAITSCSVGAPIVRLGPDTPRQANQFNNKQLTIATNLQLKAGAHTFKLEYDRMHSRIYNLFVFGGGGLAGTGGGSGLYYFDSLSDFSNRNANEFVLTTTTTGSKNDGYVDWAYTVNTFGLQDTWKPSAHLTINAGVRFDMYSADKTINVNQNFVTRYGFSNNATLNGRAKLQPRIGFNWAPEPSFRLSGGVGLFAGGLSDVFISNNYSNSGAAINGTGATITSIDLLRTSTGCIDRSNPAVVVPAAVCAAGLNSVGGGAVPASVINYVTSNASVAANALTNSLDPKFKVPAQWKANLSASWKPQFADSGLGAGWTIRADALFSRAQQAIRWVDLRAQQLVVGGVAQVAPDGRVRYGGLVNGAQPGGNYDIQLTNTTKGRAIVLALGASRDFGDDLRFSASYTHQDVKDVAGTLVSSTVSSSYGIPTDSPNSGGAYGRSQFETTHTIRANLDFKHKFFGDNETRFGINWELRSGQPYSITMNDFFTSGTGCSAGNGRNCVFGTALNTGSHLFYVPDFSLTPTNGGLTYGVVTFADQATLTSVQNLVNSTNLKKYQGKIAPKGLLTGPWYNKVDINLAQQVPFFFHSKVTALFGIENFLNLLNRNWGSYQDFGGSATIVRVACSGAAVNGQTCPGYTYSAFSSPITTTQAKPSLYTIRAGVRIDF